MELSSCYIDDSGKIETLFSNSSVASIDLVILIVPSLWLQPAIGNIQSHSSIWCINVKLLLKLSTLGALYEKTTSTILFDNVVFLPGYI